MQPGGDPGSAAAAGLRVPVCPIPHGPPRGSYDGTGRGPPCTISLRGYSGPPFGLAHINHSLPLPVPPPFKGNHAFAGSRGLRGITKGLMEVPTASPRPPVVVKRFSCHSNGALSPVVVPQCATPSELRGGPPKDTKQFRWGGGSPPTCECFHSTKVEWSTPQWTSATPLFHAHGCDKMVGLSNG